jgi:hypothetical protein
MLSGRRHDFWTADPLSRVKELPSALAAGPLEASGSEFQAQPGHCAAAARGECSSESPKVPSCHAASAPLPKRHSSKSPPRAPLSADLALNGRRRLGVPWAHCHGELLLESMSSS